MARVMLKLGNVTFPLYKLRSYISIDTNPLGLVKVTTIKGVYILDDKSINKTFSQRRAILNKIHEKYKVYQLKEKVNYLRQLVKYKSGTTFIDSNGEIFKYYKSSKLYKITSHKIEQKNNMDNWTVLNVQGIEIPFLVGHTVLPSTTHASIMHTKHGPFLYDLTNKEHEPYRRKI